MKARDSFDDLITARLRAAAPEEAPAHLMDSVVDRIDATPQRRRGAPSFSWLGSPVMRVAGVAVVVAAAVVAGTQLGDLFSRGNVGAPEPSGTEPTATEPASSASPSASATPSATSSASASPTVEPGAEEPDALLLRLYTVCDTGPGLQPAPAFTLTADGTVVWLQINQGADDDGPPLEYMTRRLTSDGLAEMRDALFGSGLFARSAEHRPERRAGTGEPPGHGACNFEFTAENGAVIVEATSWFGDEEEAAYYEPAPEREALDTLAGQLRDPAVVVGDDAWTGDAATFEASEYQLVLAAQRGIGPFSGLVDEAEIPWPFEGPVDEAGEAVVSNRSDAESRCLGLTRDQAASIVGGLVSTGASTAARLSTPSFLMLGWAEGNGIVDMDLVPRMPDGYPQCADVGS